MSNVSITVTGHVGGDPALFTSANGTLWTSFRVASTHRVRDAKTGEWRDGDTTWFTVRSYGDKAQNVVDSIDKGTPVVVTGRLAFREFEVRREEKGADGLAVEVVKPGYEHVVENATVAIDISRGTAKYARRVHLEDLPPVARETAGV